MNYKQAKRYLNKLVEVSWVDIVRHDDVNLRDIPKLDSRKGLALCKNWGELIKVDNDIIILAHSLSSLNCGDIFVIPLVVIAKIRRLH